MTEQELDQWLAGQAFAAAMRDVILACIGGALVAVALISAYLFFVS